MKNLKKLAKVSPTRLTMAELEQLGATAQKVEYWNTYAKKHKDLFGFCDVLAIMAGGTTVAIQTTSASNHAARFKKLLAEPRVRVCLKAGWLVEVWSWRKDSDGLWVCRKQEVLLSQLPDEVQ